MKFKCNNTEYEIIEKEQLENEEDVGYTEYQKKQIILKKLDKDFMMRTLKHELMHVWLYEFGHNQDDRVFDYEDVCEIVASSNDFINKIVEQYKNTAKVIQKVDNIYINGISVCELMKNENEDKDEH